MSNKISACQVTFKEKRSASIVDQHILFKKDNNTKGKKQTKLFTIIKNCEQTTQLPYLCMHSSLKATISQKLP